MKFKKGETTKEAFKVIMHDLECLEIKDTKDNKYHLKLLKGNLKDIFKMKTKELIIEALEGKRAKKVWELIEKSYLEVFGNVKKEDLEIAKEEYSVCEDEINNKKNRYILIEHYNLDEGFYCRFYDESNKFLDKFEDMFEDYFSDCNGSWEQILLVDMEEMRCYLLDKKVSYDKKEVEI